MKKQWLTTVVVILFSMTVLVMMLWLVKDSSAAVSNKLIIAPLEATNPTVIAVDPTSAYNDIDTSVIITGANFDAVLSGALVITHPTVYLGSVALVDVTWINSTTLDAIVPWGMDPGVYKLRVINPDGGTGSLSNAFTVTQGIGVWTTGGPYGGMVNSIAIHPTETFTIFASAGYGLFRSLDRGENWEHIFSDLFSGWVVIDPFQPDTVYLGKGTWGDMLYRSDDVGSTWKPIPIAGLQTSGFPAAHVFPHPLVEGTVFAAISQYGVTVPYEGLYKSVNRGDSWVNWSNNLTDTGVTALAFHPDNPQIMYVGTYNGNVFRTANGGSSWQFIGQPDENVGALAVDPFGQHALWMCGSTVGRWGGLWKYNGSTWTKITPGVSWSNTANALVFDPHQQGRMWLAGSGGFTSLNGGQTWSPFAASMAHPVLSLAVDFDDSQIVYQGYGGQGIFRTLDGGEHWQEVNQGLAGVVPEGLAVQPDNPLIAYAQADLVGLFKSANSGGSWRVLPIDLSGGGLSRKSIVIDPFAGQRVMLGYSGGSGGSGVSISEDGGESWHQVVIPIPVQYKSCCAIDPRPIAASPVSPGRFIIGVEFIEAATSYSIGVGGLAISTDSGTNWQWIDLGREISPVVSLIFDPINPNIAYAGTLGNISGELLKSTNGGITWQSLRQELGPWSVNLIAVEPGGAHRLFVQAGGVRRSNDGGQTWELMPNPMSNGFVRDLLFVPGEPPVLYAATTDGLYRSIDGAQTWRRAAGQLGRVNVGALAFGQVGNHTILYASTNGGMVSGAAIQVSNTMGINRSSVSTGVYRFSSRQLLVYLPLIRR